MFNYTHRGSLNEDYIILGIISYFLLNYPIKKKVNPIKILQRAQSVQEEIAEETEINQKKIARSLSMEYEQEQKLFEKDKNMKEYIIMKDADHYIWYNQEYSDEIIETIKHYVNKN